MTTKELKDWANSIYKEYGDMECFFRDFDCHKYDNAEKIFDHVAHYGKFDGKEVLILDLPKYNK